MGSPGWLSGPAGRLCHRIYRYGTGAGGRPDAHSNKHGHERSARRASQRYCDEYPYDNADDDTGNGYGNSYLYSQRRGDCHQFNYANPDAVSDSAAHHADSNAAA